MDDLIKTKIEILYVNCHGYNLNKIEAELKSIIDLIHIDKK